MKASVRLRTIPDRQLWLLWSYLLLIAGAEALITVGNPAIGLALHSMVLVSLILHSALGAVEAGRDLALALTLAPMIRLLSLSVPLPFSQQQAWHPVVSVPLLVGAWIIIRQTPVVRGAVGLGRSGLLQLMLAGIGLTFGVIEYAILKPAPLVSSSSWGGLILSLLGLIVFTGFAEELIFRGLLQFLAVRVLGHWALLYVSLLFAVLHIGSRPLLDVLFVFGYGILFAYTVWWSGSILGVTLAHSVANVTLFLIMPLVTAADSTWVPRVLALAIVAGSLLTSVSLALLILRTGHGGLSRTGLSVASASDDPRKTVKLTSDAEANVSEPRTTIQLARPTIILDGPDTLRPQPQAAPSTAVNRVAASRGMTVALGFILVLLTGVAMGSLLIRFAVRDLWSSIGLQGLAAWIFAALTCMSVGALVLQLIAVYDRLVTGGWGDASSSFVVRRLVLRLLLAMITMVLTVSLIASIFVQFAAPALWATTSLQELVQSGFVVLTFMIFGALMLQVVTVYNPSVSQAQGYTSPRAVAWRPIVAVGVSTVAAGVVGLVILGLIVLVRNGLW